MSWMRFFVPSSFLLLAVVSTAFFGACQNKKCQVELCQGCCNSEGICLEGNTLEACGVEGEACMRCSGGHVCSLGICLGGNPNTYPGSNNNDEDKGGGTPTSALWWVEDNSTLQRYFPERSLQTSFHFSFPVAALDVSPTGKRWAAMLSSSATQYEVLQAFNDKTHPLQQGSGVPQKIAFAQDSRGLAFLIENESGQGLLFWSTLAGENPRRLSFEKCGLPDSSVHVLDFAWSPDSSRLAVLALVGDDDMRASIWLLTTAEPGACAAVVYPGEAMEATPGWGAWGPLRWMDNTALYFRATLTHSHPLQLYSFALSGTGGMRNPVASSNAYSLLDFALNPSLSMLALLQENPSLSFLSLPSFAIGLLDADCETASFATTKAMLFSPKNDWLLLLGQARSQLIHLGDMKCSLSSTQAVLEAAWSPDGSFLAELSHANSAAWSIVLSQNNGKTLLNPHVVSMGFQHLSRLKWTSY